MRLHSVHQRNTVTAAGGDALGNGYRLQISFVPPDTYSTALGWQRQRPIDVPDPVALGLAGWGANALPERGQPHLC